MGLRQGTEGSVPCVAKLVASQHPTREARVRRPELAAASRVSQAPARTPATEGRGAAGAHWSPGEAGRSPGRRRCSHITKWQVNSHDPGKVPALRCY